MLMRKNLNPLRNESIMPMVRLLSAMDQGCAALTTGYQRMQTLSELGLGA